MRKVCLWMRVLHQEFQPQALWNKTPRKVVKTAVICHVMEVTVQVKTNKVAQRPSFVMRQIHRSRPPQEVGQVMQRCLPLHQHPSLCRRRPTSQPRLSAAARRRRSSRHLLRHPNYELINDLQVTSRAQSHRERAGGSCRFCHCKRRARAPLIHRPQC